MKNKNYPLYEVEPVISIREMLNGAVEKAGDKTAFKFKSGDGIVDVTYSGFVGDVEALLAALLEMGIQKKHIAQIGDNSYRWIVTYLAALTGDNVFVPIDKELPVDDIINILNSGDCDVLFLTEKHREKIMSRVGEIPGVELFVYEEAYGGEDYTGEDCVSFSSLIRRGKELIDNGVLSYLNSCSDPYDLKMLVYTSGTTGSAKGVMLSEHNLVSSIYYGLQVSTVYDRSLSVLPYNHTYEAVAGLLVSIHKHATICINESLKSVMNNLRLYSPDYIYLVPAFAEEFYRRIWANARKTGKEKWLERLIKTSDNMRRMGIDARKKLFVSIHEAFGGNLKKIVCGGAPIRPEIGKFFDSIGINLVNGYGITECSPLVSANRDEFNDPNTVGVPLPCTEIRFDDVTEDGDGEICVRGDIVMMGYYKMPELTAEVLGEDGWFKTGDYGRMNDKGQLLITGRKKNIIVLNNGKNIYPEEIEEKLMTVPYIKEVVVYAEKNEHGEETRLCAEVFLNTDKLKELGIEDAPATLRKDVSAVCRELPSYKTISKIKIRSKEFEKTTTNKIKRHSIEKTDE